MSRLRSWLDASPLSEIALALMRDATGRQDPLEPLRPARAVALPGRLRVAFWSLRAGVGSTTTAALVAHRSAGAGRAPALLDLDRWTPCLVPTGCAGAACDLRDGAGRRAHRAGRPGEPRRRRPWERRGCARCGTARQPRPDLRRDRPALVAAAELVLRRRAPPGRALSCRPRDDACRRRGRVAHRIAPPVAAPGRDPIRPVPSR